MPRSAIGQDTARRRAPATFISEFYREEFLKHQAFLRLQREYYSEGAVATAEAALRRILVELDALCTRRNAEQVVSRLLRTFDVVTGASADTDLKKVH